MRRTPPHRRRPAALVLALAVVAALAAACGGGATATDSGDGEISDGGRTRVVTTVAPLTSIVSAVAGDRASVAGVVPEGADSHTFEPAPRVARALAEADLVFLNGLGLEEAIERLARRHARAGAPVVELGDRVLAAGEEIFDFSFPREGGRPNPHLWTDPSYAHRYAGVVRDELRAVDPGGAADYERNHDAFVAKVDELDAALRRSLPTVPPEHRKLLTYHDAYAYFARTYGWQVVGAVQLDDFREPSPKQLAALIDQVRSEGVPAVFGSEVFPSPVLAQIGRETGVRYVDVLRDDDLPGKPGDSEHSWLGLVRFDYVTMVDALGGDSSALRSLDLAIGVPDRAAYPQ